MLPPGNGGPLAAPPDSVVRAHIDVAPPAPPPCEHAPRSTSALACTSRTLRFIPFTGSFYHAPAHRAPARVLRGLVGRAVLVAIEPEINPVHQQILVRQHHQGTRDVVLSTADVLQLDRACPGRTAGRKPPRDSAGPVGPRQRQARGAWMRSARNPGARPSIRPVGLSATCSATAEFPCRLTTRCAGVSCRSCAFVCRSGPGGFDDSLQIALMSDPEQHGYTVSAEMCACDG